MPTEYFERRERALLGDRFDALYAAPQDTAARGVTVSALRTAPEQFAAQADFPVEPSPFCKAGFVVQDGCVLLAGAFRFQCRAPAGGPARDAGAGYLRGPRRQEQPAGGSAGRAGAAGEQRVRCRPG